MTLLLDLTRYPKESAQRIVRSMMFQIHAMELGASWPSHVQEHYPDSIHHEDARYIYVFQENARWFLDWADELEEESDLGPYKEVRLNDFLSMGVLA